MSKTFRHKTPKIGRNAPCPCGSGKKFKHCHGGAQHIPANPTATADLSAQIFAEGKRKLEQHKAQERQRQKQQGLGRPIISIEHKGYRFIAAGKYLHYGKWKTFPDFLGVYISSTLGTDWGNSEIAKPLDERHTIMQWYDKICHLQKSHFEGPGQVFRTPLTGAVSAYHRLAYNLYLIAHNGNDIQTILLSRLKDRDNFQGAYYETQVAAWLIKAGFELEFEDEQDVSTTHCEFTATHVETGEKYSVEAKTRQTRPGGSSRTPVGKQLRKALIKSAAYKRLVFIDLNKALHTQEAAYRAADRAEFILKQSEESMEINGAPAPPAYVCITNMNDQHALDSSSNATMVSFVGFKLSDFLGKYKTPREAAHARDRHLPIFKLMKSIEEHNAIPQTFDGGLPSEVFPSDHMPRLKVGEHYLVPSPDGEKVTAELMDAIVQDGKATAVLRDTKSDRNWIGTFEMSAEELSDYAQHPDTYFGVYKKQSKRAKTIIELYDFFAETYEQTPKEKLIGLMPNYPDLEQLKGLSQKELVEILAERYTYRVLNKGFKPKTGEEIYAHRCSNKTKKEH